MIGDYDQFIDDIYGKINYHSDKNMIEDTIKSLSWWACLEKALTNNLKYSKHLLYSKIALLYDEYGNEEKANEYQKLAIKYEDEELPF